MHQASAELPTNALLVTSSCQEYLSTNRPDLMEALANATEVDTGATLRRLGEFALFNTTLSYRNNWRVGMDRGYIPLPFRHQGLLWWFQVLNTYLVRVSSASPGQRSLWRSLTRHAGIGKLEMFLQARRKMDIRPPPTVALPIGRARCGRGGRRPCDRIGAGWLPEVWFDVGLHIRMGDACGSTAPKRGQKARRCSARPLQDAFELMSAHQLRGLVFLATDSAEIAHSAKAIGAEHGFSVLTLPIDRKQHEGLCLSKGSGDLNDAPMCGTEYVARTRARDLAMLTDTLLDALLLSRSTVLVGSMMSNFPRLALQLRVQMPVGEPVQVHRYIPLDGRKWCTRSSCRMNYTDTYGTAR